MEEILELSITNYDQQWRMDTQSNGDRLQDLVYRKSRESSSPLHVLPSLHGSNSIYSDIEKNYEQENTAL